MQRSALVLLALTLLACAFSQAQRQPPTLEDYLNPIYKTLAGPVGESPTEWSGQSQPSDHLLQSTSALKHVELDKQGEVSFLVEPGHQVQFSALFKNQQAASGIDIEVAHNQEAFAHLDSHIQTGRLVSMSTETKTTGGLNLLSRTFSTASASQGGSIRFRLTQKQESFEKATVALLVTSSSPYGIQAHTGETGHVVGQPATVRASFFKKGETAIPSVTLESATLTVTHATGTLQVPMALEADGWFSGSVVPNAEGAHNLVVTAVGRTPEGHLIERTQSLALQAVGRNFRLLPLGRIIQVESDAIVLLPVTPRSIGFVPRGQYHVYVELYGSRRNGRKVSISYAAGMTDLQDGALPVFIHGDWLRMVDLRAPYEVRNVRVSHPDTFAVLDTAETIRLIAQQGSDLLNTERTPINIDISDEMKEGRFIRRRRRRNGPSRRLLQTGIRTLLLVNDYCVPSNQWPTSDFTSFTVFPDWSVSRSNDAFAKQILNFTASFASFGIVAHGQGGMAALHLKTYYNSGLDTTLVRGRQIQAVATPWLGSPLYSDLSTLQTLFGSSCQLVYDLTTAGAANWLFNIPTTRRTFVSYYTVTSGNNATSCSSVTAPLLPGFPANNDGVVTLTNAQLNRGTNMGNKASWCHTSAMVFSPAQNDVIRNSAMNSAATR